MAMKLPASQLPDLLNEFTRSRFLTSQKLLGRGLRASTMLSGLQKPGAIPLFALIVFSLLSLVPSLSQQWDLYNLKVGGVGSFWNEPRNIPRIKETGSIDSLSRSQATSGECEPWTIDNVYQPCANRITLAERSGSRLRSAAGNTPPVQVASKYQEPATLIRRVRSLKTLFIKQSDDYQLLRPFSTRDSPSVETASSCPAPMADSLDLPTSAKGNDKLGASSSSNATTVLRQEASDASTGLHHSSHFGEPWQQVCQMGIDLFGWLKNSHDAQPPTSSRELVVQRDDSSDTASPQTEGTPYNAPSSQTAQTHAFHSSPATSNDSSSVAEQSKGPGIGRDSEKMRGSCMAIVIGLVVGIMWF